MSRDMLRAMEQQRRVSPRAAGRAPATGSAPAPESAPAPRSVPAPDPVGVTRTPAAGLPVTDEVDDLVAGWRAERPDLDVEPMQVLSRISRLARHLDRARRAAFTAYGLESWEFDVLSALRRQGAPYQLSPGALLRATLVTSGTMTNRIDRLADAGLVGRQPDLQDKRGVLVTLTTRGLAVVDAALADLLRSERQLLTGLDTGQQRDLADLLRVLLAPFDAPQRAAID